MGITFSISLTLYLSSVISWKEIIMTWIRRKDPKVRNLPQKIKTVDVRDGGWAWVVALASCIGLTLSLSILNNFGIFYSYMIEEFEFELTSVTIIGSAYFAIAFSGAIVVVPIIERFGNRRVIIAGGFLQFVGIFLSSFVSSFPLLFFSLAIVSGFGNACSYVTFYVAVDQYFDKKKPIAMTMASTGASLSVVVFSPISEALLEKYGFHGTMLIFSAIVLNVIVCGSVVFPIETNEIEDRPVSLKASEESHTDSRQDMTQQTTKETAESNKLLKPKTDMSFIKQPRFLVFLLSNFLFVISVFIPTGLLPETAVSKGIDLDDLAISFSLNGVTQVLGRLCFGLLSHRFATRITRIWGVFLVLESAAMIIVPFSTDFVHILIFNMFSGIFMGGINIGFNLALSNIVEPRHYGRAISLALLMNGLGGLIGTPVAAFLQETTGNVDVPFYFGSVVFAIAGILMLPYTKQSLQTSLDIEVVVSKDDFKKELKSARCDQNHLYVRDTFLLSDFFI